MALEDILDLPDVQLGGARVGDKCPSPGPRLIGTPFRTANGYCVQADIGWPSVVLPWLEEAFNGCGYDIARLWSIPALWLPPTGAGATNNGDPREIRFRVRPVASTALADFPNDYVSIDASQVHSASRIDFNVWDGLPSAPAPYGGRRFFMETILHAIGHVVGSFLAGGDDLFKRYNLCLALAQDRIRAEYSGSDGFGYGFAWRLWANDSGAPWARRPQERFAEAFKDIWGLPSVRRFLNRTRTPFISQQVVLEEAQVFLPVNGADVPPHPGSSGTPLGFGMSQVHIAANSRQGACSNLDFPCYDPVNGAGPLFCVGCDSRAEPLVHGYCGHYFSYPLSAENYDATWRMAVKVPKLGFCHNAIISYRLSKSRVSVPPRAYACPGIPGEGATHIPPGVYDTVQPGAAGYTFVDGTHQQIVITRGSGVAVDGLPAPITVQHAYGVLAGAQDLMVTPDDAGSFTTSTLRIEVEGQSAFSDSDFRVADSFDFLADPFYINLGYRHIPGGEGRFRAPSTGITSSPYGELNLDGFNQGSARAASATGNEAVTADLEPGIGAATALPPSLTIEGR